MRLTQNIIAQLQPKEKRYDVKDDIQNGLFVRVETTGKKTWYLRFDRSKTAKIGDATLLSPAQARDKAHRFLSEFIMTDEDPRKKVTPTATLEELIKEHEASGGSTYINIELACFDWKMRLDKITLSFIEKWRVEYIKTHKAATANRVVASLKALLNWGEKRKLCTNTIREIDKLPETDSKTITRYLTDEENERLLKALDDMPPVFRAIVLVAVNTGIRKNALLNLKWSDVNLKEDTITLQASNAKNKKTAILPINKTVHKILSELPRESDFIFYSDRSPKYTEIKTRWNTLLKKADIHDFRFHDLRHTFASRLVMKGADLNTVRELMTHSDIQMTMRYAHLAQNVKKAAVDRLD